MFDSFEDIMAIPVDLQKISMCYSVSICEEHCSRFQYVLFYFIFCLKKFSCYISRINAETEIVFCEVLDEGDIVI